MIGCLRTHVRKQPIIALYFESENELNFYNLKDWSHIFVEIDHEIIYGHLPPFRWVIYKILCRLSHMVIFSFDI